MPHSKSKLKISLGFTLVELIVVVTILAILATIGFVSYSSYLTGVRDTNRLAQLVSISDGLELYRTKNNLPLPDDNIEILASTVTIAYQGYAGANTLETIDFTKGGKDPRDDQYFSYYLTKDRKHYQLMGFLEESLDATSQLSPPSSKGMSEGQGKLSFINTTHAGDYDDRIPTVYGKKLGILTDTENTPIQDLGITSLDVVDENTSDYVAHLSDTSTMTGATAGNSNLAYLGNAGNVGGVSASCKTLIDKKSSLKGEDGVYLIAPNGTSPFPVYCDMTTDGGGWSLIVSDGTSAFTQSVETLSDIPTPIVTGMVDYFIDNTLKDLATEMRVVSISNPTTIFGDFDITESWLGNMNLKNSTQGYMYASNKGFSGGDTSALKSSFRLINSIPGSYPANGITLGSNSTTIGSSYGAVAYSWKLQDGSNVYRLGWATPTNSSHAAYYYDNYISSYLMAR